MYKIKSAFETRENDFSFGKFNEVKLGKTSLRRQMSTNTYLGAQRSTNANGCNTNMLMYVRTIDASLKLMMEYDQIVA